MAEFPGVLNRAASTEIFNMLTEPIDTVALNSDTSRGFPLTTIKAAFVFERLNQVFGLLGYGWRYVPAQHQTMTTQGKSGERSEVLVLVAFQWRIAEDPNEDCYCHPVIWSDDVDKETGQIIRGWTYQRDRPAVWSEPTFSHGGSALEGRSGSLPATDAYKGAVTDALTKIASRLGVGQEVFKDQVAGSPAGNNQGNKGKRKPARRRSRSSRKPTNDPCSIEEMQALARAELDKLTAIEDGEAPDKLLQQLTRLMQRAELTMPAPALVHLLLGEGELSTRRVMATCNFLTANRPSPQAAEVLNTAVVVQRYA